MYHMAGNSQLSTGKPYICMYIYIYIYIYIQYTVYIGIYTPYILTACAAQWLRRQTHKQ